MASTLKLTVAHAISFLTRPLVPSYHASTVIKLQLALEANLTALFAPTWRPSDPLYGSDHRSLTLSPDCLPPRPIHAACLASDVQWFDWIALLGGRQFDLVVDPACVSVRFPQKGSRSSQLITIWSEDISSSPSPPHFDTNSQHRLTLQPEFRSSAQGQTLAQQLLANDKEEDEEIFALLADEISAPTWVTPARERHRPFSHTLVNVSLHSRSSSRSSNSSSSFSIASSDSCGSATTVSSPSSSPPSKTESSQASKRSRRERARQARIFVDPTKNQVTPYEGGKTTVLTGGVMLGAAPVSKVTTRSAYVPINYRVVRV